MTAGTAITESEAGRAVKPPAVICDVDGTMCDVSAVRHFVARPRRDFDAFHAASAECPPITETITWIEEMADAGHRILVVTARMEKWRELTATWVARNVTRPIAELAMRADGDFRPDFEVKREIHAALSRRYDIRHAVDDNPHVIRLWTEIGIPVRVVPGWVD